MGKREDRLVQRLEAQIAGVQRRLAQDDVRDPRWVGFLGGLALGALAGVLLARLLAARGEEESIAALPDVDDAILLHESPRHAVAASQSASAAPETVADEGADPLAAAELEDPHALAEIAEQAEAGEESVPTEAEAAPAEPAAAAAPSSPGRVDPVDGGCPESHPIKGNHSSSGDYIYHVPSSRNYSRTNPESCFATEEDAIAAGFRAPRG